MREGSSGFEIDEDFPLDIQGCKSSCTSKERVMATPVTGSFGGFLVLKMIKLATARAYSLSAALVMVRPQGARS